MECGHKHIAPKLCEVVYNIVPESEYHIATADIFDDITDEVYFISHDMYLAVLDQIKSG